ncbi:peptidylprolyl isomerase [Pseudodesulfovibrio sp. JC047]|uniref:SurA N-terminal domain-containing protein n=1 Tax=Pseudodesulfovibrio sp. JC047 TaxID=2683199 RepID=UPI0013D0A79D|nr:peptidylprolyl isomerase [Pseudodesulfovibrio sp. JC047]
MVKFFSLIIGAMLMLSAAQAWAAETVINRILVKINDNIITEYDLDEEMKPIMEKLKGRVLSAAEKQQLGKIRKQALNNLINQVLVDQEVARYGISISEASIDKEIQRVKDEQELDDAGFEALVAKDGLTLQDFRAKLKKLFEKQELIGHMVNKKVLVTDTEIAEEYADRKDDYTLDKMVELAIILLPSDVSAVEVKERINDEELTFAEAASKYSIGPGAAAGGSIGEVGYADLAEDWKEALRGLQPGGVSEPLTIQGKEALLSPVTISEDRLVPLEEVRDDIYKELMQKKRDTIFTEYFDTLKQSSVIVYMDDATKPENGVSQ